MAQKNQTAIQQLENAIKADFETHGRIRPAFLFQKIKEYKELEKQQIIDAWMATDNPLQRIAAEQYYNETYGKGIVTQQDIDKANKFIQSLPDIKQ